jgi:hypothetical protein
MLVITPPPENGPSSPLLSSIESQPSRLCVAVASNKFEIKKYCIAHGVDNVHVIVSSTVGSRQFQKDGTSQGHHRPKHGTSHKRFRRRRPFTKLLRGRSSSAETAKGTFVGRQMMARATWRIFLQRQAPLPHRMLNIAQLQLSLPVREI